MARRAKLEICHNTKGRQRWWYHLRGANGEIMVVSEKFGSYADARRRALRFVMVMSKINEVDWHDALA
jgi:uncharacterized protein YegP (UPF0339 family)